VPLDLHQIHHETHYNIVELGHTSLMHN